MAVVVVAGLVAGCGSSSHSSQSSSTTAASSGATASGSSATTSGSAAKYGLVQLEQKRPGRDQYRDHRWGTRYRG